MKKKYILLLTILISSFSFGQVVFQENFEMGNSAMASETCNDNTGDFFTRTDGTDIGNGGTFYQVFGKEGNFFFAAMDTDGAPCSMTTQSLFFDDVSISGFSNLTFAILLAEDKDGANFDWDFDSRFFVEIDIDNSGSFTKILQVSTAHSGSGSNVSQPMIDSDFDGVGDGPEITDTFTEYTASIGSGNVVDIRLVFENLVAGDEDISIDDIRIVNNFAASPNITVSGSASGLNYQVGNGPSNEGNYTVEGADLTNDITITAPTDFEISTTSGSGFTNALTLTQSGGSVANTPIYVRLAANLAVNSYSGDVTASSPGATDRTVAVSGSVFNPLTNAMRITGVFDALDGSSPKGVEIEVLSNIADLSIFGVGSANNGGGTDGEEFTFPNVSASNGDKIYVIGTGQTADFNTFFGTSLVPYESGAMFINGNDAIELFENGQVIDVFGDINVDGSGEAWDYVDGWASRNSGTGPDGSTFVIGNWTFSGTGQLDGTTNSVSTSPFPLSVLSSPEFNSQGFSIYPNPTNTGFVTITSSNTDAVNVQVFDMLGKQVKNETLNNNTLDVSNLRSGVYIIKIEQNNLSSTKKLIIR